MFVLCRVFENVVHYCETYSELIPLSFVLGFYVSIVMTRWWNQYQNIPWPDPIAVFVSATIHGQVNEQVCYLPHLGMQGVQHWW